jgi:AcrR family transcriptional regulator
VTPDVAGTLDHGAIMRKPSRATTHTPVLPLPKPQTGRSRRNLTGDAWRRRIIDTALILGDEYGDNAITAELVAKAAGLSRAHFYKFFTNRDDLYREVIRARAQKLADDVLEEVSKAPDATAKVRSVVESLFAAAAPVAERPARDAAQQPRLGELLYHVREIVAPVLGRELWPSGASDDMDGALLGHAVLAMAEGAALASSAQHGAARRQSIEAVARLISAVLLTDAERIARGGEDTRPRTRRTRSAGG